VPSDLPRTAIGAFKDADTAIAAGDAAKADTAITLVQNAIDAVVIDYAFINAKLTRINQQLGDTTGQDAELRTFLAKLKTLVEAKKYRDANRLLNDMAASLAKK
jgi:ribosomal protein S20